MNGIDFLLWVKGPGFYIALFIFALGVVLRILEVLLLGKNKKFSSSKGSRVKGGFKAIFARNVPDGDTFKKNMLTVVAGYVFHLGFFVILLLFAPHIEVVESIFGLSWPSLRSPLIDGISVITIAAMVILLLHRINHKVKRFLSDFDDYLSWTITFLPLLTGYISFNHLFFAPQTALALHILSVEIFMILFPFTKLMHAFTMFIARWYNGSTLGWKGVN